MIYERSTGTGVITQPIVHIITVSSFVQKPNNLLLKEASTFCIIHLILCPFFHKFPKWQSNENWQQGENLKLEQGHCKWCNIEFQINCSDGSIVFLSSQIYTEHCCFKGDLTKKSFIQLKRESNMDFIDFSVVCEKKCKKQYL